MSKDEARFQFRNREVMRARPRFVWWLAAMALSAGAQVFAQSAPRPEALIKWRQSAYQVIAWNSGRIKSALAGTYDSQEIRSAATALARLAAAGDRKTVHEQFLKVAQACKTCHDQYRQTD